MKTSFLELVWNNKRLVSSFLEISLFDSKHFTSDRTELVLIDKNKIIRSFEKDQEKKLAVKMQGV